MRMRKAKHNSNNANNNNHSNASNTDIAENNNKSTPVLSTDDVGELKDVFGSVVAKVEERIKVLEEKEAHWAQLTKQMEEHAETASQKIVLDIGMWCQCLCALEGDQGWAYVSSNS